MKANKKTIIWIVLAVLVAGAGGAYLWMNNHKQVKTLDLDNYVPDSEFKSAFEALKKQPEKAYDIEETVRILNGLEIAQSKSEDFDSYLEYMAKQDYSKVPEDVLRSKERLLPILQKMYELKKKYKELDDIWSLARNAATSGAEKLAEDLNPIATIASIFTGDAIGTMSMESSLTRAKTAAFEKYANDQKLKEDLREQIEELHDAYVDYLTDYAPVYMKYMKEWDRLCLDKDKAYLDLYAGRSTDAYNAAQNVLNKYPNNREAMLLKAFSLINIANGINGADSTSTGIYRQLEQTGDSVDDVSDLLIQAGQVLDQYTEEYPSRTAPALILRGMLNLREGNEEDAMSYFDQASVEYPRQATALTDLLDSYRCRSYLNKSQEGKYMLQLYRSTMEGYGMFSPNLLKAKYYAMKGDLKKSKEEIFNHFYRRGNQGVYDCLLSDMKYCEENMYDVFKQLLLEQSFIDVSVEPTQNWYLTENDQEIKVIINNRSDIDLQNVRIFLCLHFTDMYTDEYEVVKLPSINIIRHHDKTEVGTVKLDYEDKNYNDITHIRAIAMTDDKICWIDNVDYKYVKAYDRAKRDESPESRVQSPESGVQSQKSREEQFLKSMGVDKTGLEKSITSGIKVYCDLTSAKNNWWNTVKSWFGMGEKQKVEIELPRIVSLIDPVFSLNEINDKEHAVLPSENYLTGTSVKLKFDYTAEEGEVIPLYIYSNYTNMRITILFTGNQPKVQKVEIV